MPGVIDATDVIILVDDDVTVDFVVTPFIPVVVVTLVTGNVTVLVRTLVVIPGVDVDVDVDGEVVVLLGGSHLNFPAVSLPPEVVFLQAK